MELSGDLPSGDLTVCYGKCPQKYIVDLPVKNSDFPEQTVKLAEVQKSPLLGVDST